MVRLAALPRDDTLVPGDEFAYAASEMATWAAQPARNELYYSHLIHAKIKRCALMHISQMMRQLMLLEKFYIFRRREVHFT